MRRLPTYSVLILCIAFGLMITLVVVVGQAKREEKLAEYKTLLESTANAKAQAFTHQIDQLRQDVQFLAKLPSIQGMARARHNNGYDAQENSSFDDWTRRLKNIFLEFSSLDHRIAQIRLIGVADHGKELIRVDRVLGIPTVIPDEQLQAKGDRDYFLDTLKLNAGEVSVSAINLNQERGKIQIPHQPMLRVSTPLVGLDGKVFAMIVLNCDVNLVINELFDKLPSTFAVYFMTQEGDFVFHPDPGMRFGFDLGQRHRWADEFSTPLSALPAFGAYTNRQGLWHVVTNIVSMNPDRHDRDYILAIALPDSVIATAEAAAQRFVIEVMLVALLILALYLYLFRLNQRRHRQLTDQQAFLAAIVENSSEAIISQTLNGVVTSWNLAAQHMFDYSAQEAIGKTLRELVVPPDRHAEDEAILRTLAHGQSVPTFNSVRCKRDGTSLPVSIVISSVKSAQGHIIGAAKTVRDITAETKARDEILALNATLEQQVEQRTQELHQRNQQLQRAGDNFAQLVEEAPYALVLVNPAGTIERVNTMTEATFGYLRHELIGQAVEILLPEGVRHHHPQHREAYFNSATRREMSARRDLMALRKDGSQFPVEIGLNTVVTDEGTKILAAVSDISQRRAIEWEKERLSNILELTPDFIGVADMQGNLKYHNRAALTLVGLPLNADLSAFHIKDMHPEWAARRVLEVAIPAALASGVWEGDNALLHHDGHEIPVSQVLILHRNSDGTPAYLSTIMRDMTERRQRMAELAQARLDAEQANRAKSSFIANMSHEIRTPLNAVLGMLQLMQRSPLTVRQQDYVQKSETAARSLLGILNDILDFSKVEAGKLVLDIHPFRPDEMFRNIGVILAANVGTKPLEILFDIDPALPLSVMGDSLRLQQILINLLGNAIKFTEQGEILLSVRMLACDEARLSVRFEVRDTGIGISPAQWAQIFESFSQAEAATTRRYGGTGLGLTICKRLVELMGGELTGESTVGTGTTFRFDIALKVAADSTLVQDHRSSKPLRILIVDDNPVARDTLVAMVNGLGWKADAAESGEHVLALLNAAIAASTPYDAVLLDWFMPGCDGFEVCRQCRQRIPKEYMPIIVMVTAHGRDLLPSQPGEDLGLLDGLVVKPVTASMIFDAVVNHAQRGLLDTLLAASAPPRRRLHGLRVLLVEDNPTNQQVASELLGDEGALVTVANDGYLAVEQLKNNAGLFDVVLMDIQMPVMDGYTATRKIRTTLRLDRLPIIAMTANALQEDHDAALLAGMNDHIGKPFDLNALVATLLQWCRPEHPPRLAPRGQAVALPEETIALAADLGIALGAAIARMDGNVGAYQRALSRFVVELQTLAQDLQRGFTAGNRQAILHVVHSLKGMAGSLGTQALFQLTQAAEKQMRDDTQGQAQTLPVFVNQAVASLSECIDQTRHAGLTLLDCMAKTLPPEPVATDRQPLSKPDLEALAESLAASNMNALSLFSDLRGRSAGPLAERMESLGQAIDNLNFSAAGQICNDILARWPEGGE